MWQRTTKREGEEDESQVLEPRARGVVPASPRANDETTKRRGHFYFVAADDYV
ncbi:hypothetical protein QG37_04641 [Candidozyma auris]|uniref:Uncharacterized protein n=1 Tax=Candidozyma auris TaxID=498019 RepID=A0A0L0NYG1_CANAR|nr:hypothetical protein QG37_04641 [[Candida] auris]